MGKNPGDGQEILKGLKNIYFLSKHVRNSVYGQCVCSARLLSMFAQHVCSARLLSMFAQHVCSARLLSTFAQHVCLARLLSTFAHQVVELCIKLFCPSKHKTIVPPETMNCLFDEQGLWSRER